MADNQSPRVPVITKREQVPKESREKYDLVEESRGKVSGPFTVLLNSPEVGGRIAEVGTYVRFENTLPGAERELAIITTARKFDCAYEWEAHEPLARDVGVRNEAIECVIDDRNTDNLTKGEAVIVRYGRQLFRDHSVSDAIFTDARDEFGITGVTDLTVTMGYYALIACALNAFEVLPDDGASMVS